MTTPAAQETSLEAIRREIDAIDDGILDLIGRRIAASARVRTEKSNAGALVSSPIRPAREALILRRLLARAGKAVPPNLLVRLWRIILTSSTLAQAPVTIHISRKLAALTAHRLAIGDHFGAMPVAECQDEAEAMSRVSANTGDLCVVGTNSLWAEAFAEGHAGEARIIGVLPVLRAGTVPDLLVFGHPAAQPTGDDETIVVCDGKFPADFGPFPRWQRLTRTRHAVCLPGFLSETASPLLDLMRSHAALGLRVAGRYPSPIEVKP